MIPLRFQNVKIVTVFKLDDVKMSEILEAASL